MLVADDHPICAATLVMAAHAASHDAVVEVVETLAAVEHCLRQQPYALVLLDLMLPDAQGLAGPALVHAIQPDTTFAVVTARDDADTMRAVQAIGARGFLSKATPVDTMIAAIATLLGGGRWFAEPASPDPAPGVTMIARLGALSAAQLRVLRAVARGLPTKQIAYELDLAEPTIKSHLSGIFRKLGVTNRTQAVLAYRMIEDTGAIDAGGPADNPIPL
ncbi:response regulator transcription factor [Sphingomonas baiyangensis]|uniref:response regulator transcription factor n=1 Tax=Sphingomonas baiyangensis TaxID=2572576 RepID=UPI0020169B54|nr:response regulator transcription factor [Sphingomonas baiyangensis]